MSRILHLPARHGRASAEIAEALVRSGAVDVIVIDSVAAMVPRAEIEGEMGDSHPGCRHA
jgi:recombination protein RecA